jgi:hypothetical protein
MNSQPKSRRPLHLRIQALLLLGVSLAQHAAPPTPQAPPQLRAMIDAVTVAHQRCNVAALHWGHRYRSAFWASYLLSALAVLSAMLPLALGWDDINHSLHPWAGIWAIIEIVLIGSVAAIHIVGHREDWQGNWLKQRTEAELTWYLPMVAPLVLAADGSTTSGGWYRPWIADPADLPIDGAIESLSAQLAPMVREHFPAAWAEPQFRSDYARWTVDILQGQVHYHRHQVHRQEALLHRVHKIGVWLFSLTALGALLHLWIHSIWLSVITTFFPALGASLHGALAQNESFRLAAASERSVYALELAIQRINAVGTESPVEELKAAVSQAVATILSEHQDWQMLIRPHRLPLA